jgi:hypothetical protein
MKINFLHKILPLFLLLAVSCQRMEDNLGPAKNSGNTASKISATLTEGFETGTKGAYTAADVTLSTGVWNLNNALIGTSTSDRKSGIASARVVNSGKLTMKFDKAGGAGTVSISHAKFGTDANGTWQLWYSTNSGTSYTQGGGSVSTVSTTLATTSFTLNLSGSVRIEIRKTDAGTNRINFDNITITDYSSTTNNPVPAISTLSPSSAAAGSAAITLSLSGSNFINGSVVNWNGTALPTTFVSSSSLTASVASTLLATAGTASVNVFNPAPGGGTSGNLTFTINSGSTSTAKKFLFDASQAETAGNADWVVDQDNGAFVATPTPGQSGITSSTSETYWLGGISAWGVALAKRGHTISTLPASGLITFGSTTNTQDLSKYDVFVICEPNKAFTTAEKQAIVNYVNNGGGLVLVGNHNGSDRDNDGWDAPRILNDLFTNNGIRSNPFGMSLDLLSFSGASSNVSTTASPITNGLAGVVTSMENNSGTSITINTTANSTVRGHIWRSGATQSSTNVLCASSTYGNGRVFLIGDSSPPDDGTGASGNTLFNGWGVFSHAALLTNASLWAAKLQ